MKLRSAATNLFLILSLFGIYAESQNYTMTLFDRQNGAGNRIMTYTGPMLTNSQLNGGSISGFVINPAAMNWTTPPISADNQSGSFLPCNAYPDPGTGGPNGEANITCFSAAPGTTNGVPLFSFCFQGGAWPLPVGTYNVDSAHQSSCGNYFFAYSQQQGYSSYAFLNNGSIVVVKNNTLIVTSLADDGSSGTLRSVIASANSGDTITFGVTGTISLAQGTLEINKNLTISGPGITNLTISGIHAYTVFQIDSGAGVNISGVTVQDGLGGVNGGDIANYGVLTLSNSTLLATTPSNGQGGGLYNAGTANVAQCTFTGSLYYGTAAYGGGIYNGGSLSVVGSTFSNFGVGGYGGAIFNAGYFQSAAGTGTVTNSTFWQNAANEGAAIFDAGTTGTFAVVNSTFSGNGGNSTVYALYGGTTLKNTLIANSGGKNCSGANGPVKSGGYNLSDDNSCSAFTQPGDMNNTPAGLDPNGLKNNGGPTQTVAILATSPAFNIIPLTPTNYCTALDDGKTPIATDQRGISRPQVSACDIGAFEYSSDNDSALAVLSGGNAFSGNQTFNGSVSATNLSGNGSGLTGVNAATAATASGLNCAGCVGNMQLGVNYAGSASQGGPASNALLFGGMAPSAYASLGSNTFTGQQFMPALSVSSSSGNAALTVRNSIATGIQANGVDYGVYGTGAWGLYGSTTSASGVGVQGTGGTTGAGVAGLSYNGVAISGVTLSAGTAGVFNATNGGKILSGQNNGTEVFSVANNGNVNSSGNLSTSGSVTIGGGTPITEYVSTTDSLTIPALTPGSCTTFTTAAVTGFTPGASDTIALGTPASLLSSLGSGIFLQFQAWETTTTTSPTITIQVCNPTGVKYKGGATGIIRVDVFKH